MPKKLAPLALVIAIAAPVYAEVTVTTPDATIVVTPPGATPVASPPPPPAAREHDGNPCLTSWASATPRRQRFALGFAKSHLELGDDTDGKAKSLLGRIVLRHKFEVELELTKATIGDDSAKSLGGALLRTFGSRKLQPYVLAGGGGGVIDRADGAESHMHYAEFGGGLMLKLRHFAFGVDFRGGRRRVETAAAVVDAAEKMATPASDEWTKERYHRARILALFYF